MTASPNTLVKLVFILDFDEKTVMCTNWIFRYTDFRLTFLLSNVQDIFMRYFYKQVMAMLAIHYDTSEQRLIYFFE